MVMLGCDASLAANQILTGSGSEGGRETWVKDITATLLFGTESLPRNENGETKAYLCLLSLLKGK